MDQERFCTAASPELKPETRVIPTAGRSALLLTGFPGGCCEGPDKVPRLSQVPFHAALQLEFRIHSPRSTSLSGLMRT